MGRPIGDLLSISHTKELAPGDLIHVVFVPGHLGFFKYGAEAAFTVIKKTPIGEVFFRDQSGSTVGPLGGSKEKLLSELRKLTDFQELSIIRPKATSHVRQAASPNPSSFSAVGESSGVMPPVGLILGGAAVVALLAYWASTRGEN